MRPAILLIPALAGCAEPPAAAPVAPVRSVDTLVVHPAEVETITGPTGGQPVQFTAEVTWDDGTTEELTLAEWGVSNRSAGTIDDAGLFIPDTDNGGLSWITARYAGAEGKANLTVRYEESWEEEGADRSLLEGKELQEVGPETWLYPQDGVNVPRNTPALSFQWEDPDPDDPAGVWRLRFISAVTDISVFTASTEWTADEQTWQRLASTNAGGSIEVRLYGASETQAWTVAEPLEIRVNRLDARGAVYYWSTSAKGVRRLPYGGEPEDFVTESTTGRCVGCHAIGPGGQMAFTFDGGNGALGLWDMDQGALISDGSAGQLGNFMSFSPDGLYLLSATYGTLVLHAAASGEVLGTLDGHGHSLTHPDWSPDGDRVIAVSTAHHGVDWSFGRGSIVSIPHLGGGSFGAPEVLFTAPEGWNAYYPAISPDGRWIAFNMSSTETPYDPVSAPYDSTNDAYDDPTAALYIMPIDGGTPIELAAANLDAVLTNSWPKWGPLPDDDVLWLAFSSKRPYGRVTSGNPQVWVTGIDPERLDAGEDGSWPAFWLPGQDPAQNNHIPVWADD
jgi:hypothetical protein